MACAGAFPLLAFGQAKFAIKGGQYPIIGSLPGDQVFPHLALNRYGGYVVWQDNRTDGDGFGISARHINRSLSASLGVFRINENGAGEQTGPQVALLNGGGAVFTWQSTVGAATKTYARFMKFDGTFLSGDVAVSTYGNQQISPAVVALPNGNALVVWAAITGQPSMMLDVFGRIFTSEGVPVGQEFQINQTTLYNQRTPAVALLPNGNVIVAWVSERLRGVTQNVDPTGQVDRSAGADLYDMDVMARLFKPTGEALSGEFKVNSDRTACANPCISAGNDGFLVAWSGKPNAVIPVNQIMSGWDVYARPFALDGTPRASDQRLNSYTRLNQYAPKASWLSGAHFVLWTSLGQDGSREGVVARLVLPNGELISREFRVNTQTASQQMHPAIAATGASDFLAIWTSFVGGTGSFDLFAQRYSMSPAELGKPAPPYVSAVSQTRLSVTWPELSGYTGVTWLVYMDQSSTPVTLTGNQWTATGLVPGSTHTFQLAYKLSDGSQSFLSDTANGRTWGEDANFDGLPDDWQGGFWGADASQWPGANEDSDGDGATNLQEFLAGTNPTDSQSVLRTKIVATPQGWRLQWNSEPGLIYQVQHSSTLGGGAWQDLGSARLAAEKTDSILVTGDTDVALYRVIRLR